MTLAVTILVLVLVMVLCVYLLDKYVPLDETIKRILQAIIVVVFVAAICAKAGIF